MSHTGISCQNFSTKIWILKKYFDIGISIFEILSGVRILSLPEYKTFVHRETEIKQVGEACV